MSSFISMHKEMFYLYIIIINIITFISFVLDKSRARNKKWRIPESRLLLLSLLGGTIGGLIGMVMVRHKIKNPKFTFGMPIILVVNIITWFYLI